MRTCEARDVKLGVGPAMTTFTRNVDQPRKKKKRPMRGGKSIQNPMWAGLRNTCGLVEYHRVLHVGMAQKYGKRVRQN